LLNFAFPFAPKSIVPQFGLQPFQGNIFFLMETLCIDAFQKPIFGAIARGYEHGWLERAFEYASLLAFGFRGFPGKRNASIGARGFFNLQVLGKHGKGYL
jgi:hypothetical protein